MIASVPKIVSGQAEEGENLRLFFPVPLSRSLQEPHGTDLDRRAGRRLIHALEAVNDSAAAALLD